MEPSLWLFTVVGGPMLLILVMYFGLWRNRKVSRHEERRTEEATRELREDIKRDPQYREE